MLIKITELQVRVEDNSYVRGITDLPDHIATQIINAGAGFALTVVEGDKVEGSNEPQVEKIEASKDSAVKKSNPVFKKV